MGNSEVGHLTIGAGRIIFQDLMRVYDEINSGRLAKNQTLLESFRRLKKRNGTLHFLGLLSDGGVHSHIDHLFSLLQNSQRKRNRKNCCSRVLGWQGHSTAERSEPLSRISKSSWTKLETLHSEQYGGRYYAMDRDNRWDRTKLAYDAIIFAKGKKFDDPIAAVRKSYESGVNDEFLVPVVNRSYHGVKNGDLIVFFNFRPDRARATDKGSFTERRRIRKSFDRKESDRPKKIEIVIHDSLRYQAKQVKALLKREHVRDTLSNVLEKNRISPDPYR